VQLKQKNPPQKPQRDRISFSEFKIWNECSYRHKLIYIDEEPNFSANEFTTFGTAVHTACENIVPFPDRNPSTIFQREFETLLQEVESYDSRLVEEMRLQAENIFPSILPSLQAKFGKYEVVAVEEALLEPMERPEGAPKKNFKGFIDLVIRSEDGRIHIIDWKTCSWGWNARKKTDKILAYQLVLYKNFYSKKYKIEPEQIDVHFALLKRTAKKNNVEFVSTSSGPQKTKNALKSLEQALKNIDKGFVIKNRLSCKYCSFHNTEKCT